MSLQINQNKAASEIDRSPLLKPSEFWGPKKDRPVMVPTDLFRSPKDTRQAITWWQPVTSDQDLSILQFRNFRFAKVINDFFAGKMQLSDFDKILNPKNAKDFLNELKIIELMKKEQLKGKKEMPRSTRDLREFCAVKSEGQITSAEAFLKTTDKRTCEGVDLYGFLATTNPNNLIPERVKDLARVTCNQAVKILSVSRKLTNVEKPITILLRGNFGVGKSRALECLVPLETALYSPDSFKSDLRRTSNLTNQQVHKEGAKNYTKIMFELRQLGTGTNFVFDETLRGKEQVEEILETAAITNNNICFREFDAPLLLSCLRVLGRDIKTEPCIPFNAAAGSFSIFRKDRLSMLKAIQMNPNITDFKMMVTTDKGKPRSGVAAEKIGKKPTDFRITDPSLYTDATTFEPKEVDTVRTTVITKDLLEQYAPMGGIKMDVLKNYIGYTIERALDERAATLPSKSSK